MESDRLTKKFCETAYISGFEEAFTLILRAGDERSAYAFTPQHMKRLFQCLRYHIIQYEKEYGAIDAEWSPYVKSPIQIVDVLDDAEE